MLEERKTHWHNHSIDNLCVMEGSLLPLYLNDEKHPSQRQWGADDTLIQMKCIQLIHRRKTHTGSFADSAETVREIILPAHRFIRFAGSMTGNGSDSSQNLCGNV